MALRAAAVAGVEYQGGGSNRSLSFTDTILRRAEDTNVQRVTSLILGVGEVKGTWQMNLPPGTKLEDALRNPELRKEFLLALQQASA